LEVSRKEQLEELSATLGHEFGDLSLLDSALTHRSYIHEVDGDAEDNERLELLGDAVLGLIICEELLQKFPEASEGDLSKVRSRVVSEAVLARQASELGLGPYLALGKGESEGGGRGRSSILADAFEAVVAALYVDGGLEVAGRFVLSRFRKMLADPNLALASRDPKTTLQEMSQESHREVPVYRVISEDGPDHDKRFEIEVEMPGGLRAKGRGRSKKAAEQAAARSALAMLRGEQ